MIWLVWMLLTLPIRLVFGALRLVLRTGRFVGLGRLVAFGAGVGVGMAIAPTAGTEDRALRGEKREGAVAGPELDLGDAVRHELAHSPRTWHLPQPGVTVEGDRVVLTGEVPHDDARGDLARTAGAVVGVAAVDNRIIVSGP